MSNCVEKDEILVSIACITYNHAPYIKKALDGFVNQKTNFKYEIIVHDDASTDGTADIISEYVKKYPDLFVPILQKENMYSKKIRITTNFVYPKIRGKYVAFCEGDDFWLDENKLQKQVDFLEKHPEYTVCTHANKIMDMRDGSIKERHAFDHTGTVAVNSVIEGDGDLFATSTVVARTEYVVNMVPFRKNAHVGDYPLMIHLALEGKVFYFDEVMSCYRFMVPGSWNCRNMVDIEKRKIHYQKIQAFLEEADKYSEYRYTRSFQYIIQKNWFNFYFKKHSISKLKKKYSVYYSKLSFKKKLSIYASKYMPHIFSLVVRIANQKDK